MKIFYPGARGGGYGWGVFGDYMTREFAKMDILAQTIREADVCFMPLVNHDFAPCTHDRTRINVAMTFFEYALGPDVPARAKEYDIVFVGSTWCKERLAEVGVHNTEVLIQGVDHSIFYPRPRNPDGKFRIFSGGKFEWRKGQDLVIHAFREFSQSHPDAHLVCSWGNLWPQLVNGSLEHMYRRGLNVPVGSWASQEAFFEALLTENGIARDRFTILPPMTHDRLAEEMAQTDCGLFPNRCEGGTNLVLMEYAAMNREVIANAMTGHADVADEITTEIFGKVGENHWAEQEVSEIVGALEWAHSARYYGSDCPHEYTWRRSAETVANAIAGLGRKG